eukprot:1060113-Prorocentrum_minimum.AAC.1
MEHVRNEYSYLEKQSRKQLRADQMQEPPSVYSMQLLLSVKQMRVHLGGKQDCPFTVAGALAKGPAFRRVPSDRPSEGVRR